MPIYDRIESNRRRTFALMLIFVILIVAVGAVIGELVGLGPLVAGIALIIAILVNWAAWYKSDSLALKMVKARPANPRQDKRLLNLVGNMSIASGLPLPRTFVIEDTAINAFATGRDPQHSIIVVTTGAVTRLKREELQGVIAHEMSHIKNRDTLVMMAAIALVGTIIFMVDIAWHLIRFRGGGRGRANILIIVVGIVMIILAPLLAQLLKLSVSRRREYLADADAALMTRFPQGLANALEKIKKDTEELEVANDATAHLFIANPFKKKDWLANLFSTHPPLEERIKILRGM